MADRDWFDMHRVCGVGTTGFGGRRALPATVAWTFGLGFAALIASSFEAAALPPWGQAKTSPPASTSDTLVSKIAVFGEDNRKRIPKRLDALRGSIGVIYNERSRTVCSAFCVADDVIATASHCVFRTKGETPPPPEKFFFARPGTASGSVRFAGTASRTAAQHIVAGMVGINTKPPIDASRDWALVKLQSPACRGKNLPVVPMTPDDIETEANAGRLFQAAFHRDFGRWAMAYSQPCFGGRRGEANVAGPVVNDRDFNDPLNLVLHSCDTGGASSGSPLLIESAEGPKVVAINVGTFVQSRVMIEEGGVVKRAPPSPVANTAVSTIAFAGRIDALRSATVLTTVTDIRALQQLLISARLLDGPPTGRFESETRLAIEQFEVGAGLTVLGVPTRALLEHLTRNGTTR